MWIIQTMPSVHFIVVCLCFWCGFFFPRVHWGWGWRGCLYIRNNFSLRWTTSLVRQCLSHHTMSWRSDSWRLSHGCKHRRNSTSNLHKLVLESSPSKPSQHRGKWNECGHLPASNTFLSFLSSAMCTVVFPGFYPWKVICILSLWQSCYRLCLIQLFFLPVGMLTVFLKPLLIIFFDFWSTESNSI